MLTITEISKNMAKTIHEKASSNVKYYGAFYNDLIGVVGVYRRAWFATEICHLLVLEKYRRQGIGTSLVKKAINLIDTPLVVATVNNEISKNLFVKLGFKAVETFINHRTGNTVSLLILNKQTV